LQNKNGNDNSAGNGNGNNNKAGNGNEAGSGNTINFPSISKERRSGGLADMLSGVTNTIGSVTNPTAGSGNTFKDIANGNGNGNGNGNSAGVRSYPPHHCFTRANASNRTTMATETLLATTTRLLLATLLT
jgi:hypothetical protein